MSPGLTSCDSQKISVNTFFQWLIFEWGTRKKISSSPVAVLIDVCQLWERKVDAGPLLRVWARVIWWGSSFIIYCMQLVRHLNIVAVSKMRLFHTEIPSLWRVRSPEPAPGLWKEAWRCCTGCSLGGRCHYSGQAAGLGYPGADHFWSVSHRGPACESAIEAVCPPG